MEKDGKMEKRTRSRKCEICGNFLKAYEDTKCKQCEETDNQSLDEATGISGPDAHHRSKDDCGRCNRPVKSYENGIMCDTCKSWFHVGCEKVNKKAYDAMKENPGMLWFCIGCRVKPRKNEEEITELRQLVKDMTKQYDILLGRMKVLEEALERKTNNELEKAVDKIWEKIEEREEKRKRKNNIVIYNFSESTKEEPKEREDEDKEKCENIIRNALGVGDFAIEKVVRLGKRGNNRPERPRPTLVKLKEEKSKWDIIKNAKKLRDNQNHEIKRIGISLDMTEKEREKNRRLREELREKRAGGGRWIIKQGEVINIDQDMGERRWRNQEY